MSATNATSPSLSTDGAEAQKAPGPDTAATEAADVYPVHTFDDVKFNQVFVSWPMVFNDVLDAEELHDSLTKVLELPGWRKLAGRIVVKVRDW